MCGQELFNCYSAYAILWIGDRILCADCENGLYLVRPGRQTWVHGDSNADVWLAREDEGLSRLIGDEDAYSSRSNASLCRKSGWIVLRGFVCHSLPPRIV